jgi:hypothetical protein
MDAQQQAIELDQDAILGALLNAKKILQLKWPVESRAASMKIIHAITSLDVQIDAILAERLAEDEVILSTSAGLEAK